MPEMQFKDEWLNRAFETAFFIHGDRETAKEIAVRAMNKLETASNAQFKRFYYTPTGRAENSRAARSRVSLNDLQLLQRLVLVESEHFERETEPQADEKTLLKFFIKHLVRISLKRNSFYVTLAVARILHNYATNEAMEIYNIVVQDPERVHDDYYYRSRKGVLMKELKKRFGKLLETVRGSRGEERFDRKETDETTLAAARECLKNFTPWNSICAIPESFDPFDDTIKPFCFDKDDPDEEHRIEVNRIHAALHPVCFRRLTEALRLPPSEQKMEIPKFMMTGNRPTTNDQNRQNPPPLGADELRVMKDLLSAQAESRKAVAGNFLRVFVDGVERAEVRSNTDEIYLDLDETAELIELRAPESAGGIVLATHLLSFDAFEKGNLEATIRLENGREISLGFRPEKDSDGEITAIGCTVGFTGEERTKTAAVIASESGFSVSGWFQNLNRAFRPALAIGLILLVFGGGWLVYRQFAGNDERIVEKNQPLPKNEALPIKISPSPKEESPEEKPFEEKETPPDENDSQPAEEKSVRPGAVEKPSPKNEKAPPPKRKPRVVERSTPQMAERTLPEENGTDGNGVLRLPIRENRRDFPRRIERMRNQKIPGKSLAEMRKIFIEITGDEILGAQVKDELAAELGRANLSVVPTKDEADGRLIIHIRHESDGDAPEDKSITAIVRLVNEEGFLVFPDRQGVSGWKYVGVIGKLPPRIAKDLTDTARRTK
jgi:hypothetical protein